MPKRKIVEEGKPVSLYLPRQLVERLEKLAVEKRTSVSALVREILERALEEV